MSDSLLFGYSVEENDGKFVITLAGKLAVLIMQDIGANIEPGSFWHCLLAHDVSL
ncbi:hypothetical protein LZK76_36735 (plasmid) [Rhizobium leguminosarum]|nr:hypothetical protein LZK76_36735 [Rhizobium leguminosarum]